MDVHYRVLFLSHKYTGKPKQPWWDARQFSMAVKRGSVNGYFHYPRGFYNQKIEQRNVFLARQLLGKWLLDTIAAKADGASVSIVPIPCSDAHTGSLGPFRHYDVLTDCLKLHPHGHHVADILRFNEAQKKAHEGGPRFEDQVYPKLVIAGARPGRSIVLFDDLVTSGGHMKACRRKLTDTGANVLFGVVCARTVQEPDGDPWEAGTEAFVNAPMLNF